jgi:hypothetical protein
MFKPRPGMPVNTLSPSELEILTEHYKTSNAVYEQIAKRSVLSLKAEAAEIRAKTAPAAGGRRRTRHKHKHSRSRKHKKTHRRHHSK